MVILDLQIFSYSWFGYLHGEIQQNIISHLDTALTILFKKRNALEIHLCLYS